MKPLFLAAAITLATPPFPPPRIILPPPDLRCDWGSVGEMSADHRELVIRTEAGPLTLRIGGDVKVVDAEGKPLASVAELRWGQRVRAYYVVDRGARAKEIDVAK